MKHTKRIFAILLSLAMMLSMTIAMSATAFAANPPSGSLTVDPKISVTGLQDGDEVTFYRVLKWDNDWVTDTGFTLTDAELNAIKGDPTADPVVPGKISKELAGKLGTQANNAQKKFGPLTAASGKVEQAIASNADAGLYIAMIKPAKAGYSYNPVFVGADFQQPETGDDTSSTWKVEEKVLSYDPAAMAKVSKIPVDKTAVDPVSVDTESTAYNSASDTVSVGDVVNFTVTSNLPVFASNYTNPYYAVSDSLSTGLELVADSVELKKPTGLVKDTDYEITENGKTGFTVNFKTDYLKKNLVAADVEITYKARVTGDVEKNVNPEDNTVTVEFSNNPSDSTKHGVIKDKTKHYSYTIDGIIDGSAPYKVTEVVKIGVNAKGEEITETRTLDSGVKVGALEGAEFKLYTTEADATAKNNNVYTNDKFNGTVKSDEDGRLNMKGLDAGTYYLMETKAPDGYIAWPNPVKVEIIPTFTEKTETETVEGIEVTYKYNELVSYVVKIDNKETASFSFSNNSWTVDEKIKEGSDDGKIKNTQGTELPSTGGIGTVIFYTIGTILVIGCGIVLISRRRLQKNK